MQMIAKMRGFCFTLRCKLFWPNISIGGGLRLYRRLRIKGEGKVTIGRNCTVSGIRGDTKQYVTIYTHSPEAHISIGDNVKLFAARLSSKFAITIGNDVLMEESGIADTDFHSLGEVRNRPKTESKGRCQVTIGDGVCIGVRTLINKGVTIGENVIIAPGSVVTRSIPSHTFVIGNPARVYKDL